jgi:hypothetical protein
VCKAKVSPKEVIADIAPALFGPGKCSKRVRQSPPRSVQTASPRRGGLSNPRVFSRRDRKPFDELDWERRTAEIIDDTGKTIFR